MSTRTTHWATCGTCSTPPRSRVTAVWERLTRRERRLPPIPSTRAFTPPSRGRSRPPTSKTAWPCWCHSTTSLAGHARIVPPGTTTLHVPRTPLRDVAGKMGTNKLLAGSTTNCVTSGGSVSSATAAIANGASNLVNSTNLDFMATAVLDGKRSYCRHRFEGADKHEACIWCPRQTAATWRR